MYDCIPLLAAATADESGQPDGSGTVNGEHFIVQLIAFLVVALLIHFFVYRPVLKVLEARRKQIEEDVAEAESTPGHIETGHRRSSRHRRKRPQNRRRPA